MKPHPFYLYQITDEKGSSKTSSVIYYPDLKPDATPTGAEVRTAILEAMSNAAGDFDWPSHGEDDKGMTFELFGPFFPGGPVASMTQAEYNEIDEGDLP